MYLCNVESNINQNKKIMGRIKLIYQSLQTCEFVIDHWQGVLSKDPKNKKALKFLNRAQYRQRQLIKQKGYYEKFI